MLMVFLDQTHSRLKNQIWGTNNAFKYSKIVMVSKLPENRNCTTVEINNDIEVDLTVHCKSKTDDLGVRTLGPGIGFQFEFTPSIIIFARTLYYCSFQWPGDDKLHFLDVYDEDRWNCNLCSWRITRDGGRLNGGRLIGWNISPKS
ncbi:hypothetical protein PIB30_039720 [Stylosanthes scabra]|uniref:S-protein homolog n=1 Tax=Stylosanthes scabra TaxID=79078 RepID=A0ABU6QFW1_9FABA|nr:hypothetical protein [Stylosanthes scabra]